MLVAFAFFSACGDGEGSLGDNDGGASDADPNAPDADPNAPTDCDDSPGLTLCGDTCADLDTSVGHCGSCGNSCDGGQACIAGSCVSGVGALVLSEVHAQEPAYFELYNGESVAVDLADHQIQWNTDNAETGAVQLPSFTLAPNSFVVLREGSGTDNESEIFVGDTIAWESSIALRLLQPNGSGIDFVRTGDANTPPPTGTAWTGENSLNPSTTLSQSLVRNIYAPDTDSEADWTLVGQASPGLYCAQGGVCGDRCLDLQSDIDNCGACGLTCDGGNTCIDSECQAAFTGLWISEYRTYGRAGVEIHNPTASAIDITNFRLDISGTPPGLSYTFPAYTLAAGAFVFVYMGTGNAQDNLLFAGVSSAFAPDVSIGLFDDGTTPLDFIRVGGSMEPPPAGTSWFGDSIPLESNGFDIAIRRNIETFDTDSAADWRSGAVSTPGFACYPSLSICDGNCVSLQDNNNNCGTCGITCGSHQRCLAGVCASTASVVISELVNAGNEYIELFNGSNVDVDIGGYQLQWVADAGAPATFTIPANTVIGAGLFWTFSELSGTSTVGYTRMGTQITWNESIAVGLVDEQGQGVDFAKTGSALTTPPSGTNWTGAAATNPVFALKRTVYGNDSDSAADWIETEDYFQSRFCDSEYLVCAGACTDARVDRDHCGACGNQCPTGASCYRSQCVDPGMVRLGGSNGVSIGRVEFFRDLWGWVTIYASGNTNTNASVACKQLGYASGSSVGSGSALCEDCSGTAYNMLCSSENAMVSDCEYSFNNFVDTGMWIACD